MAPPKFDDLPKTAKDVLNDDYQDKGTGFKSKLKTNFEGLSDLTGTGDDKKEGAILTTAVEVKLGATADATPAKLTWKFPKPFGMAGIAVDKLELEKGGKTVVEASIDKACHGVNGVKVEVKGDLTGGDPTVGVTYTGIAELFAQATVNATNPQKYTALASYSVGSGLAVGVKSTPASMIDVGAQYANGPMFFSVLAQENFKAFTAHCYYKVNNDLKVAAQVTSSQQLTAGIAYNIMAGTSCKAKLLTGKDFKDMSISAAVKRELAKGVTLTAGSNVPLDNAEKKLTWGAQINIE